MKILTDLASAKYKTLENYHVYGIPLLTTYLTVSCIVKLQCILYSLQGRLNRVPPVITLPYQPPDVCASTATSAATATPTPTPTSTDGDGDGSGASQLMYSTVAIIFLALMAVSF